MENEIGFMKKESDPDGSFSFLLGGCCEACVFFSLAMASAISACGVLGAKALRGNGRISPEWGHIREFCSLAGCGV